MNDPMKAESWLVEARKALGRIEPADNELERTVSAILEKAASTVTAALDDAKAALVAAHSKRREEHQAALKDADGHVIFAKLADKGRPS